MRCVGSARPYAKRVRRHSVRMYLLQQLKTCTSAWESYRTSSKQSRPDDTGIRRQPRDGDANVLVNGEHLGLERRQLRRLRALQRQQNHMRFALQKRKSMHMIGLMF